MGYRSLNKDHEITIDLAPEAMEHLEKLAKLYKVAPNQLAHKILSIAVKAQFEDKDFQKYLKENKIKLDATYDLILDNNDPK